MSLPGELSELGNTGLCLNFSPPGVGELDIAFSVPQTGHKKVGGGAWRKEEGLRGRRRGLNGAESGVTLTGYQQSTSRQWMTSRNRSSWRIPLPTHLGTS